MGYQGRDYALVSMTNKDVYYIDSKIANQLEEMLGRGELQGFIKFTDTRSNSKVTISLSNISSIVVLGAKNG